MAISAITHLIVDATRTGGATGALEAMGFNVFACPNSAGERLWEVYSQGERVRTTLTDSELIAYAVELMTDKTPIVRISEVPVRIMREVS